MATKKLFWEDPYLASCTAKITSVDGKKVKLDQTVFYAFSGGQESDSGTIGGFEVVEAIKQGDKESIIDIEYELAQEPGFSVGDCVEVVIDAKKRDKLRKLHSAAHLLYYITIDVLGKVKVVGSNISSTKARMDFNYDESLSEVVVKISDKLNSFILEDHAIVMEGDSANEDLRWWNCGVHKSEPFGTPEKESQREWRMPCGGTHVKSSGEIGKVCLKTVTKGKGKKRIEIHLVE